MTAPDVSAIRERAAAAASRLVDNWDVYDVLVVDVPALLAALDAAEAENARLRTQSLNAEHHARQVQNLVYHSEKATPPTSTVLREAAKTIEQLAASKDAVVAESREYATENARLRAAIERELTYAEEHARHVVNDEVMVDVGLIRNALNGVTS